jgi:error-prone DNA polymerase
MAHLRPTLAGVLTSRDLDDLREGQEVTVAGLVVRRQRPMGSAVFITLEDEFGHIPLIIWSSVYEGLRQPLSAPLLRVQGTVSRREGTLNIVVSQGGPLRSFAVAPKSKDWG